MSDALYDANLAWYKLQAYRAAHQHIPKARPKGVKKPVPRNKYIWESRVEKWGNLNSEILPGALYFMTRHAMAEEAMRIVVEHPELKLDSLILPYAMNGYVLFDRRDYVHDKRASALLDAIPVHGGITWNRRDSFGRLYGFDTAHYNSKDVPADDPEWVARECYMLYRGLERVRKAQKAYIRATTLQAKSECYEFVNSGLGEWSTGLLLRAIGRNL